jgi:ferredoxin-NADP reductase
MLAKKYRSEVVSIENPFKGIYTLEFQSFGSKYKYLPGQFLHIALDSEYDGSSQWPESRCFSMQSNPNEETIKVTYSVKGAFTQEMEQTLQVGSEVWLKLPYGDLFQKTHNKSNTVFIAGGTGITPYLSLFTHDSFTEYNNPKIYLGFRSKAYHIYQEILDQSFNGSVRMEIFIEDEVGMINIEKIFKENGTTSCYFISGPPEMISKFKGFLIDNGVESEQILTDDWE